MTHPYTKLAEDLDVVRQSFREMDHADRNPNWFTDGPRAATAHRLMWQRKGLEVADSIDEAASILRAAASVDVAELMAMVYNHMISDQEWWKNKDDPKCAERLMETQSALESALRMALAARVPEESDGWIAIPEGGMPPLGEQVLVWCKYGPHWGPMVDCWDEQHEAPVSFSSATIPIGPGWDSGSDFEHVTHWRPIAAPKGTP